MTDQDIDHGIDQEPEELYDGLTEQELEDLYSGQRPRTSRPRQSGSSFSAEIARKRQNRDYAREKLRDVGRRIKITDRTGLT